MSATQLEFIDSLIVSMGKANIANAQVYSKKTDTLNITVDATTQDISEQEEMIIVAEGSFQSYFTRLVLQEYKMEELDTYIQQLTQTALENKLSHKSTIIDESIINRIQSDSFKNSYIQKTMQNTITQTMNENASIQNLEIIYTKQTKIMNIKNINNKKMTDGCVFESICVVLTGQNHSPIVREYGYDFSKLPFIVACAVEKLTMQSDTKPLNPGFYTTVFSASVVANLLAQYIPLFLADKKESLVEKKGYLFSDARISIMDKPNFTQGKYTRVFDDVGISITETDIVENGLFCNALQTEKTAIQFKVKGTGNNFYNDTYTDIVALPTNVVVCIGNSQLDTILKKLDNGVYINEIDVANSLFSNETGDFTMVASGCTYNQKVRGEGIVSVKIASNLYELLTSIENIGDTLDFSNCNDYFVAAPCLKVKKVEFI